ncbi:hypothetical protein BRADI_2g08829v3 [Brachypodium distachyon]|uniref:Uncharacterized protein n=1 Tax=Brachypodium distachyon TaxID=15368 RepID=A0A2K2D7J4_BRADI|nr:hypothetical protein BRADI_2g08829v3 [Brachypodium distachyon]
MMLNQDMIGERNQPWKFKKETLKDERPGSYRDSFIPQQYGFY